MENSRPSFDRDKEREAELYRERERQRELEKERERQQEEQMRQARRQEEERERERQRQQNDSYRSQDQESEYDTRSVRSRGREPIQDRLRNGLSSRAPSQTPSQTPTQASTRVPSPPPLPTQPAPRRDPNARISFFDPANQAAADRLLFGASEGIGVLGEEDPAEATMANVEEMLEGIEWGFAGGYGGAVSKGRKGAGDMIEARLLDELMALEKVSVS